MINLANKLKRLKFKRKPKEIRTDQPESIDLDSQFSGSGSQKKGFLKKPSGGFVVFVLSVGMGLLAMQYSRSYIEDKVDYYKGQLEKTEKNGGGGSASTTTDGR